MAPARRVSRAPGRRMGMLGGRGGRRTLSHRHLHAAVPWLGNLVAGGDERVVFPVGGDREDGGGHSSLGEEGSHRPGPLVSDSLVSSMSSCLKYRMNCIGGLGRAARTGPTRACTSSLGMTKGSPGAAPGASVTDFRGSQVGRF